MEEELANAIPFDVLNRNDPSVTTTVNGAANVRRSRPRMTRFERTKILAMRSEQIANGTVPFVEKIEGDRPLDIAEREFAAGRTPFIIRRFVPTADRGLVSEDWKLEELEPCDRRLAHRQPTNSEMLAAR